MKPKLDDLAAVLSSLATSPEDRDWMASTLNVLDGKYALSQKVSGEPGLSEIIKQLVGRSIGRMGASQC